MINISKKEVNFRREGLRPRPALVLDEQVQRKLQHPHTVANSLLDVIADTDAQFTVAVARVDNLPRPRALPPIAMDTRGTFSSMSHLRAPTWLLGRDAQYPVGVALEDDVVALQITTQPHPWQPFHVGSVADKQRLHHKQHGAEHSG